LPDWPGLNWCSFGGRPGPTLYSSADAVVTEAGRRLRCFRPAFPFDDGLEVMMKSDRVWRLAHGAREILSSAQNSLMVWLGTESMGSDPGPWLRTS
jgi:hypothetical protein